MAKRPSFIQWATSKGGLYLHDKVKPTLAQWQPYQVDILNHIFPAGEGPLPYNRICWSDVKKSGKSELASGVHIYFALFVDVPGEQYALSNDYDGAKSRIWRAIVGSLEKNPVIKDTEWRVVGSEIIFRNGSSIKAIANDYRGEAGGNQSFVTVDEPWGIVHEGGLRLMTEFTPVPTRENSTIFYTGYQGFEDVSNFWHNLIDMAKSGEAIPELAHIEDGDGNPACYRNGKTFLFWNHKPRLPWHTPEYLEDQRKAFTGREAEYFRVWENRRVRSADAFCTEEQWGKLYDAGLRGIHADDKRPLVVGIDAATKSDSAALVVTGWNDETKKVEVLHTRIWQPGPGQPIKLTETIGPEIVRLHQEYNVRAVYFDPYQMAAVSELCQRSGVRMVEFPQTTRRIQSDMHLHGLIWGGNLSHTDDPLLKKHVLAAVAQNNQRGMRIVKDTSGAKVDAAVALSMSALGAVEQLARTVSGIEAGANPFYGGDI